VINVVHKAHATVQRRTYLRNRATKQCTGREHSAGPALKAGHESVWRDGVATSNRIFREHVKAMPEEKFKPLRARKSMAHSTSRIVAVIATAFCAMWAARAQSAPPVGPSDLGTLTLPFTTAFGHSFGDLSGVTPVTPPSGPWAGTQFNFTDAYVFSYAPASSFSSFIATIDLGGVLAIGNFQAALFPGTPLSGAGTFIGSSGTTSGAIAGLGWTASGPIITLSDPSLPGGQYTLEVRGLVTGSAGGSYAGVLNITPVPEASTAAMMLAGLGIAGAAAIWRRRRNRSTTARSPA
jgi:hypothetical protein